MKYYLAIDIGASSGRHMLGSVQDGKLRLEEVYRFPNGAIKQDGQLVWDVDALFGHILAGMQRCKELGKIPVSVGIDTWGVDFVLLDENGTRLGPAVCYRDSRTQGMEDLVEEVISFPELYGKTGIARQIFNTIYQLTALKRDTPELLEQVKTCLFMPDYFHYRLTGKAQSEYTIASTSAMVEAERKDWDGELMKRLGLPADLFQALTMPGTCQGALLPEVAEQVGYSCSVILPPSHDTASAYLAAPTVGENAIYLSSGTWSLMGIESSTPIITDFARTRGFTNEGGFDGRFRFLKNIMGLWMIQCIRRETGGQYSFPELAALAEQSGPPLAIVDVNNKMFLSPDSMIEAVKQAAKQTNQTVPETLGQVVQCIYHSLARCYADTVKELETATGRKFHSLYIMGGGSQDRYLNALTAKETGLKVYVGPVEGTVIGNLMVQMMTDGVLDSLETARQLVRDSVEIMEETGKES